WVLNLEAIDLTAVEAGCAASRATRSFLRGSLHVTPRLLYAGTGGCTGPPTTCAVVWTVSPIPPMTCFQAAILVWKGRSGCGWGCVSIRTGCLLDGRAPGWACQRRWGAPGTLTPAWWRWVQRRGGRWVRSGRGCSAGRRVRTASA